MQQKISIIHLVPFVWTMGNKKGLLQISCYMDFSDSVNIQPVFIGPDINIFNPKVSYENIHDSHFKIFHLPFWLRTLGMRSDKISLMTYYLIVFFKYVIVTTQYLKKARHENNILCMYAHTWVTLLPASIVSKIFEIPIVYRIYGFHNYKVALEGNVLKWVLNPDILFTKIIKCELYVISDDGTFGDKVVQRLGVPKKKILFLLDGVQDQALYMHSISVRQYLKEKYGIGSKKVLYYVGRLDYWKHVDRIICLLDELVNKLGFYNVKLLIIGDGNQKANLESLVKKYKLEQYVSFLGSLEHDQVMKLHEMGDIYITMQDLSNLTNSLLEAMASGKCIVAGDIGGTKRVIRNDHTGLLIPINNLSLGAKILFNLLNDEKKMLFLGGEAAKFARNNFLPWKERIYVELKWVKKQLLK